MHNVHICSAVWSANSAFTFLAACITSSGIAINPRIQVATHFSRSPSTLSHLVANLEKLSRNDGQTADALRKHLYAIMQA